jgi:hypothetical protein
VQALHGDDGSILSNPKNICHKFNVWFHSVFHLEELSNMPQFSLCDVPSCPVVFFDLEGISDRLKYLDGNKSIGSDTVFPYVLKQCYSSFSLPLSLLFQKSYNDGIVPSSWKLANITPVYKSRSRLCTNSYRGISLLSVLCKIMERIIGHHIMNHLLLNNLLSKHQHGFVRHLFTSTNLLDSMDIISGALNGFGVDVVYLDFIKAFDRVPHKNLIMKLGAVGISGNLLS